MNFIPKPLFIGSILLIVFPVLCVAQDNGRPFQSFTVNEGLPQNYLLGLAQDSAGFIWIGTKDGLARYDGYRFLIYRHGRDSVHTPAANNITNLSTDYRGYLWVQYDNRAIDRYNPSTGIFEHITKGKAWDVVRSQLARYELLVDHHDNLWIATENAGVFRYGLLSGQLLSFSPAPPDVRAAPAPVRAAPAPVRAAPALVRAAPAPVRTAPDPVRAMMEDRSGNIWLASQHAFTVYDYATGRTRDIPFGLSARQTYSGRNYKLGLGETAQGKIVLTSLDSTVLVYEPARNAFQTLTPRSKRYPPYDAGLGNTNPVPSADGDRWLTCNGRIFRIDHLTDDLTEFDDPTHPSVPDASALLIDRSGNLWFGKNATGLCKVDLHAPRFVSKKYTHANFETDILVGELGVDPKDLPAGFDNPAFAYMFRNSWDSANKLLRIQNYLLGRHLPQLVTYAPDTRKLTVSAIPGSADGEVGVTVDEAGHAWAIGINNWAPIKLDGRNAPKTGYPVAGSPRIADSLFRAGKVAINPIVDHDRMWVMASNANIDFGAWELASIDLGSNELVWHRLVPDNTEPSSNLLMMVADPSSPEYLWIGTSGNGLLRWDKTTGGCHAFTTDDGLPNNTIYAIVPDDDHNLWLSSNKGLTRFNPITHSIRNFDIADGLIGNEFNRWHCFKLPDGRIAFGGMTGYTIFNPADIRDDTFQPRTLLTNLLVNNQPLAAGPSPGDSSLNARTQLIFPHDQNFLSFEFASDEYNRSPKLAYRYRLRGIDNDWVYAGNERLAHYTKLPPGRYLLEIDAANTSGLWSRNIRQLEVVIVPPWWQTGWAYLMYLTVAGVLIASFFRYRLRRIRLAQQIILQQQQTEQLKAVDAMKSRFFTNITHEFRTPLSLIISPVEQLKRETSDERTRKTLSTIKDNASRLLQLINQLLDLSKLDAGSMRLNVFRGRLDLFMADTVQSLLPLAERNQQELTWQCSLSQEYLFDAEKVRTILTNLIANALKFTPAGGKIQVNTDEYEVEKIRIVVRDTGIGIPADKLPFIFDRFFQADDSQTRAYEGTGIGLALVRELVLLMKGTVTAESWPNGGTSMTVVIPAAKAGNRDAQPWRPAATQHPVQLPYHMPLPVDGRKGKGAEPPSPLLLIVEDNEELLDFLWERVTHHFRVLAATNGVSALQIAREQLPDLVISDVMMPEMDGYALCRKLKQDSLTGHIAVILLTAKSAYDSRLAGLQMGADDYISKPFHLDELEARIGNLLDHQEKQRAHFRAQLRQEDMSSRPTPTENQFLKNIYAVIDEMIDDPQLGPSKLAERNAMSLRTLNRKLNVTIGLTAGDLIRQYRLQKSLLLLKEGRNVSEAAYLVGFETPAYFSQCFKDQYGVSPRDYFADTRAGR